MTRIVYVNGQYRPYRDASIHVEDRGFQFADSIYEVCEINDGALIDETRHLERLEVSLRELSIPQPMSRRALSSVMREVVKRNRVNTGLLYIQVSRGRAPRDFPFPSGSIKPTLVCLARRIDGAKRDARRAKGIAVRSMPDLRWARCDIKTVMLLPACLAKENAQKSGAQEAWFVDAEGYVTEGASSNAWIIDTTGTVITRPLSQAILPGVTRKTLIDLLNQEKIPTVERKFHLDEALSAAEAFITSASGTVMPDVSIDGRQIGSGMPGRITLALSSLFHHVAERSIDSQK